MISSMKANAEVNEFRKKKIHILMGKLISVRKAVKSCTFFKIKKYHSLLYNMLILTIISETLVF